VKCQEWGLNLNQGALFDLLNQASSWAKPVVIDNEVYYWISRNMIIDEIPLAYSKPDTVYRAFKDLSEKGLIVHVKQGQKDLIRLTEKGKEWNAKNSEINPNVGNKSDILPKTDQKNSEINPTFSQKLGNKSEKTAKNSDLNPTDKNTNYPNTNNQCTKEKTTPKKQNFVKPTLEEVKNYYLEKKQVNAEQKAQRFVDYYESVGWKVGKNPMKDWKAAVRTWISKDNQNNFSSNQGFNHANHQPTFAPTQQQSSHETYSNNLMAELERELAKHGNQYPPNDSYCGNVYDMETPV
jgi:DNA-binding PadR family transcriptional regulator